MPSRSLQEVLIVDFSPGIFSSREFAASLTTADGAAAEFIASEGSPPPSEDYTLDRRTLGADLDISGRDYTYGCVGTEAGLMPLPAKNGSHSDTAFESDTLTSNWRPFPRQVTLATAIMSPVNPRVTEFATDYVPGRNRDQLHVLSAWYHNSSSSSIGLKFGWRTYTNYSDDSLAWTQHDLIRTVTNATVAAHRYRHTFESGGLAVGRLRNSFGLLPHVVAAFGQEHSSFFTDGWQGGAPAPGDPTVAIDTTWGTWYHPYELTNSAYPIDPTSAGGGDVNWPVNVVSHQNRFVVLGTKELAGLEYIDGSPGVDDLYTNGAVNEILYYNDANASSFVYSSDPESFTFITDAVGGFGSWVSMNAGELFMVKNHGGGVAVRGSVADPQQVNLPGVASTYGAGALGAVTPAGYIYGTRDGVFLWSGSDTTEHISTQLGRRWFWNIHTAENDYKSEIQPKGKFAYRPPFVYVTGNWIFDIRTKAWWRLAEPSATANYFSYEVSANGTVYAFNPSLFPSEPSPIFDWYDTEQASSSYRWVSQPLTRTRARSLRFREIRVTATGRSKILVHLVGLTGQRETVEFPADAFSNVRPTTVSGACRIDAEDVTVVIEVEAEAEDAPAATIHRLAALYEETHQTAKV